MSISRMNIRQVDGIEGEVDIPVRVVVTIRVGGTGTVVAGAVVVTLLHRG